LDRVIVEASASSANLGPGFDVFALALDEPRDVVEMTVEPWRHLRVTIKTEGEGHLPQRAGENSASAVVLSMARRRKLVGKVGINLRKRVPIGVGLGSSGASSAAAAKAADILFNLRLGLPELIESAGEGERVASGAAHLDNVTAAMAGGFVVVPNRRGAAPVRFEAPRNLEVVIVTPKVKLPARKTAYARRILPRHARLKDVVHNVSNASKIVAGFATGDIGLIGEGMDDAIVEVARKKMVPGYEEVKRAAKSVGAAGICISGAGPSVLALLDVGKVKPREVLHSIVEAFGRRGVESSGFVTKAGGGARVVESR